MSKLAGSVKCFSELGKHPKSPSGAVQVLRASQRSGLSLLAAFTFSCSSAMPVADRPYSDSAMHDSQVRPRLMDPTEPPNLVGLAKEEIVPPNQEEMKKFLEREGADWFYGKGLGATLLNVGTIVLFPPYGLYLLFNAGMKMAGEEPVYISDALPEGARKGVTGAYNEVVSAPGKLTSTLANEEFRE